MIIPDKQQAVIDIATKFVGVHEVGYNDGPEIEVFQSIISKPMHQSWCCDFVQYCVHEVDKKLGSKTILFPTESCHFLWVKTPQEARILIPEPGCLQVWAHYNGDVPTGLGHVGIVREVLPDQFLTTIEGNTSPGPGIERQGDGVYIKRRPVKVTTGDMRTVGFLIPWLP